MRFGYYPGCSLHSTAVEYSESFEAICPKLDIELVEVPKWICCGSTPAHSVSHKLSVALPAKIMLNASDNGLKSVLVPCASCFQRLKTAQYELCNNESLKNEMQELFERKIEYNIDIIHPLALFKSEEIETRLKELKKKSLRGLKIACYYGCLLTRPPKIMNFDECENPVFMDNLLKLLDAETVRWNYKTICCGASLSLTRTDLVLKLLDDILSDAKASGANCISVACPLCHSNLDTRQAEVEEKYNRKYNLPVFYFSQLVGLSLGISPQELGLNRHLVDTYPLLSEANLLD